MAGAQSRSAHGGLLIIAAFAIVAYWGINSRHAQSFVPVQSGQAAATAQALRGHSNGRAQGPMMGTSPLIGVRMRCGRTGTRALGLFYSTQTGNTENVATAISEATGIELTEIGEVGAEDLAGYDGLIVGCPTWNTGADEYRSGTAWDDVIDEIKGLDLAGKPVAVFGCGDSQGYGDNFCDGIEELHETFAAAGAKMIGYVDSSGYQHAESKSDQGGKFLGLPCDEDNESDMTEERVSAWVKQLKSEGMPL